jgi:uncharacterized protein YoxC
MDIRLIEALKEINDKLHNMDKTLTVQQEQLAYHIKRTDLLEEQTNLMKKETDMVADHVSRINTIGQVILKVFAALGVIASIMASFGVFR